MATDNNEGLTARVTAAVQEDNRRASDKWFNSYIKPHITPVILGLIAAALGLAWTAFVLWADVYVIKSTVAKMEGIVNVNKDDIVQLKVFQTYQMADIVKRLDRIEQERRK